MTGDPETPHHIISNTETFFPSPSSIRLAQNICKQTRHIVILPDIGTSQNSNHYLGIVMLDTRIAAALLQSIYDSDTTLNELISFTLHDPTLRSHPLVVEIINHPTGVIDAILSYPPLREPITSWALSLTDKSHARSIQQLIDVRNGWHFTASQTSIEQIQEFRLEDLIKKVKSDAPALWRSITGLLSADNKLVRQRSRRNVAEDPVNIQDSTRADDDDEEEFWAELDGEKSGGDGGDLNGPHPWTRMSKEEQRKAIISVVKLSYVWYPRMLTELQKAVWIISIMMQSSNQKCNFLQSVIGIFLHSCNTPQKVVQMLARTGCSISVNTINKAIKSLSAQTYSLLRDMGQTLQVSYTYDNFDIDFKTNLPTVEQSGGDTLTHLTSGTLVYLEHGDVPASLRYSQQLWDKSPLNPHVTAADLEPTRMVFDFMQLHPEPDDPSGLTRTDRFNAWMFYQDLCMHGPPYFAQFRSTIGLPEFVEKIPVVKMRHAPARAMDINQSSVSGNIQALRNLLEQGGIGEVGDDSGTEWETDNISFGNNVIIVNGDLATGERIYSILDRRSIEDTPALRFQHTIYVMGLFHLKMACADALWRLFIEKKKTRDDENSLMHFVALHRSKETGKIGSSPGFRRMHDIIQQEGTALRLDAWRTELTKRNPQWQSLDCFANSQPTESLLRSVANSLATDYVAGSLPTVNLWNLRQSAPDQRDAQRENVLIMHQYFLLYEELTHAMNHGDIGRIETQFPPWMAIFKSTGKHKYAKSMSKFLNDVHWVYPKPLAHIIRYNILVNPKGKEGAFRALDWVQELNNLKTKVRFRHLSL